jgi:hypothetical protein
MDPYIGKRVSAAHTQRKSPSAPVGEVWMAIVVRNEVLAGGDAAQVYGVPRQRGGAAGTGRVARLLPRLSRGQIRAWARIALRFAVVAPPIDAIPTAAPPEVAEIDRTAPCALSATVR